MVANRSSALRSLKQFAMWLTTTSLSMSVPCGGMAQPAPPGTTPEAQAAGQPDTNPPAIAGSLADMAGSVSFHASGETQWSPATLNYPVTNGEGFWTEPQASATIDVADDKVVLDESTEFDVATLDQNQFVATEAQGAIFIQLATVQQGQTLTVNTPRGSVQISQAGQYEIVAGDTNDPTTITAVTGAAHITGTNLSLDVGPNQTATITGADTLQGSVGPTQMDAFLKAQLQQATTSQASANVPQDCRAMTGGAQLASYGSFTQTAQYGQVWYPSNVPSTWAPYRDGHWAYVAPWGWTWVDNARWGFAPFHYGRWAQIDGRWGWLPSGGAPYVAGTYPVYSPALVAFVGVGAAALGFGGGAWDAGGYAPAWIPLGPREPYYPWYHFREGYFAHINGFYGVPRTIIDRGPAYYNSVNFRQTNIFINRRSATVIPAAAFARGQAVMAVGRPLPEHALAEARPLAGRLPVRPTAFTPNLPPQEARRLDIPVPDRAPHSAAGPRILPISERPHTMPELRHAALPRNLSGSHPAPRPYEAPALASHGLPTLRAPGAHPEALHRPAEPDARMSDQIAPRSETAGRIPAKIAPRPEEAARQEAPPTRATRAEPQHFEAHPAHAHPDAHDLATHAQRPEVRHDAHPVVRPEPLHREAPRPAPRLETHAAPRPEARPEPHIEQPRPAPRPAPRPESPPEPKHEPHHG